MTAKVHDVITTLTKDLRTQSEQLGEALRGAGRGAWMSPEAWAGDPTKIPDLHKPGFDRTAINQNYQDIHAGSSGGHVGDAASLKIQLDTVAVDERAFRMRHATNVRCLLLQSGRSKAHGNEAGVLGSVLAYAQDLAHSGGNV